MLQKKMKTDTATVGGDDYKIQALSAMDRLNYMEYATDLVINDAPSAPDENATAEMRTEHERKMQKWWSAYDAMQLKAKSRMIAYGLEALFDEDDIDARQQNAMECLDTSSINDLYVAIAKLSDMYEEPTSGESKEDNESKEKHDAKS